MGVYSSVSMVALLLGVNVDTVGWIVGYNVDDIYWCCQWVFSWLFAGKIDGFSVGEVNVGVFEALDLFGMTVNSNGSIIGL